MDFEEPTKGPLLAFSSGDYFHSARPDLLASGLLDLFWEEQIRGEGRMWIFDSYYKGNVHLWGRERGLSRVSIAYPPSFYMYLKDPATHREMIEALINARKLRKMEPKVKEVCKRYREKLREANVRELAIHRRVSRLSYSHRCTEASAVKAHLKQGIPLAPGMEIGYVVKDAGRWQVEPERTATGFDARYYRKLLGKAWEEAAFVQLCDN